MNWMRIMSVSNCYTQVHLYIKRVKRSINYFPGRQGMRNNILKITLNTKKIISEKGGKTKQTSVEFTMKMELYL